jgi:hypothetical protein
MTLELHLKAVGVLILAIVCANFALPRHFGWRQELSRLSLLTRQIFIVHCLFIVITCTMFGLLALVHTPTLLQPTPLARLVLAGLTIFWTVRLFVQLFVYDTSLWRGNLGRTVLHVILTLTWAYFAGTFGWALYRQLQAGGGPPWH